MTRLVLASSSPRRRALLVAAGIPPDAVTTADVDETPLPAEDAEALVRRLARAKLDAVTADAGRDDSLVVAADTVVATADAILGKPVDDDDARAMLQALAGASAAVLSGVAVGGATAPATRVVRTVVRFRALDRHDVDRYVATGEPRGAAGAFRLQGAGAALVAGVEGCPSNVVGLPVCETTRLLRAAGMPVHAPSCPVVVARVRAARDD